MTKQYFQAILFLLFCLALPLTVAAQTVNIPDANLRAVVEKALGKASGNTITVSDIAKLTSLKASNLNISDLTGLEGATNLTELWLGGNNISDLSPVSGLTNLRRLYLNYNSISDISLVAGLTNLTDLQLQGNGILDISPVAGLTNLRDLWFPDNGISDISPVAGLTDLTGLILYGNNISDLSPVSGLTNLTSLYLGNNSISDISPVSGLTKLTDLWFPNNGISDLSPVSGLINLRYLNLRNNNISDISPLVANTGLGSGDTVDLRNNYLLSIDHTSIKTHIPTLQSRGVGVHFRDLTHVNIGEPPTVRLIYFLPNDRPYQADVVQRLKTEIRVVQDFYATEMQAHGYGNITFRVETDPQGEPMVHRVDGEHPDSHHIGKSSLELYGIMLNEVSQQFNVEENIYAVVFDRSRGFASRGGRRGKYGGGALVDNNTAWRTLAHELGHAFGLQHNFRRNDKSIMSYVGRRDRLSACSAEYLSVHPYFNPNVHPEDTAPTVKLISPRIYPAEAKNVPIKLKVSDAEGLHQVILFVTTQTLWLTAGFLEVKACQGLGGETDTIVEFDYDGITPSDSLTSLSTPTQHPITIEAIDVNGNTRRYSFNLESDSPESYIVDDPWDLYSGINLEGRSLASVLSERPDIRRLVGLGLEQQNISDLVEIVSALSGMPNLKRLDLLGNLIADLSPMVSLTNLTELRLGQNNISDISVLSSLTNLTELRLSSNNISDLSALSGLTNLTTLNLGGNNISDLSPVSSLNHLTWLELGGNSISDLSPVSGLTNLTDLWLSYNNISDLSPISGLTNLIALGLSYNNISDLSALSGLNHLERLDLRGNLISDISVLAGLHRLKNLYVRANPLSYTSIYTYIPALQARGVQVTFNERIPRVVKRSGDQHIAPAASLPIVVEVQDSRGARFEGVPVTFTLTAGSGTLSITATTTDRNGQAESTLTLGADLGTRTVEVSVAEIEEPVTFTIVGKEGVIIPDSNLRAKIGAALGKTSEDQISPSEIATLTFLQAQHVGISNLTGLEYATNLTELYLRYNNNISDISPVSGLTKLTYLYLGRNNISDLSPMVSLTNLTELRLGQNNISDLSPLSGLTKLTKLYLSGNSISDLSPVSGLTKLTDLSLNDNNISDISVLSGLTKLTRLYLSGNSISNLSPVSGLTKLTLLDLNDNSISDLSPLAANTGLGSGDRVHVRNNSLSYISINTHIPTLQSKGVTVEFDNRTPTTSLKISGDDQQAAPGASLARPLVVGVQDQRGHAFAGVPVTFAVTAGSGTLSTTTTTTDANGRAESTLTLGSGAVTNTVNVSVEGVSETVTFTAIARIEFDLPVPAGISLIHVPLKVTAVDGVEKTITSIADLYDALGGASKVNFLITHDSKTQEWHSYFGTADTGTVVDRTLTDDMGIIAGTIAPGSVRLTGSPLGTDGSSTITLNQGLNLVGLPLRDSRITRVSDLFALEGVGGNVPVIILTDGGDFKAVGRAGDDGDIRVTGGQSFILTAQAAATVAISGDGWYNISGTAAAPLVGNVDLHSTGIQVTDTTPVLALRGSIVDGGTGVNKTGFRVTVKNLSTPVVNREPTSRSAVATVTGAEGVGYQLTIVDIETGRAAMIGDILEVAAQSTNPFIGVHPLRYTVTAKDVKRSLIKLPALATYEIPTETELLANYPNPFNPETWIPYRLAEDAFVTLTIYGLGGRVVRTLDVGHRTAAAYENRSKAIYWDGRNGLGERVASGVYFYHLSAGDYSATRRMVILK